MIQKNLTKRKKFRVKGVKAMNVGEICIREVVIIEKDESIIEASRLMREYHVGDVIVVDRGGDQNIPVGILTDRDIVVALLAHEVDLNKVNVGDAMSYDLLTAREGDNLFDVVRKMQIKGVRRIPVVNDRGGLVGILSVDDMIELFTEQLAKFTRLFKCGLAQEVDKID